MVSATPGWSLGEGAGGWEAEVWSPGASLLDPCSPTAGASPGAFAVAEDGATSGICAATPGASPNPAAALAVLEATGDPADKRNHSMTPSAPPPSAPASTAPVSVASAASIRVRDQETVIRHSTAAREKAGTPARGRVEMRACSDVGTSSGAARLLPKAEATGRTTPPPWWSSPPETSWRNVGSAAAS